MYGHILIPTDGSDTAERGVEHGLSLAKALGAKVTIVIVTDPLPSHSGVSLAVASVGKELADAFAEKQAAFAESVMKRAKEAARGRGVPAATLHVTSDHVAEAIVEAAKSHEAGLIVMASHGRRGLGRLVLGSQASGVINHSSVPVLVVR